MTNSHVLSAEASKRTKMRIDALDAGLNAIDRARQVHAIIGEEARADGYSGHLGEFRFDAKDIAGTDEPGAGTDRAAIIAEILSYHEGSGVGPSKSELEGKSDAYLVGRLEAVRQYAKADGAAAERVAHKLRRAAESGLAEETEDDDAEKALAAARKRKAEAATRGDAADYAAASGRNGYNFDMAQIAPATEASDRQRCADLRQARVDAACAGMRLDQAAEAEAYRKSVMRLDHATPVGSTQNFDAASEDAAYQQSVANLNAWRDRA